MDPFSARTSWMAWISVRLSDPRGGVHTLWDTRCAALTAAAAKELTGIDNVRLGRPRCGNRGVEAHGIATLSN